MNRRFLRLGSLAVFILALAVSGCQAAPANLRMPSAALTPSLPTPEQHVSALPTATWKAPPAVEQPSPTPFPDSLAGAARAQYGERLIDWIHIEKIGVKAPVAPVGWSTSGDVLHQGEPQWDSPEAQVGWVATSALPGQAGNVILYGHNNIDSSIFLHLYELQSGDVVELVTGDRTWRYQVDRVQLLPVLEADADRLAYAEYLKPTLAPRLTIISCYPPTDNTHRVIVIAYPVTGK